jgi:hypothetical protein
VDLAPHIRKQVPESFKKYSAYIITGAIALAAGGFLGHTFTPPVMPKLAAGEAVEIQVKSKAGSLHSTAIIKDGHTYYKEDFVNKWHKAQGSQNRDLKNLSK